MWEAKLPVYMKIFPASRYSMLPEVASLKQGQELINYVDGIDTCCSSAITGGNVCPVGRKIWSKHLGTIKTPKK